MESEKHNILGLPFTELTELLRNRYGKGDYHATAIYREVFQKGNPDFLNGPEFRASPKLAKVLSEDLGVRQNPIHKTLSEDGVVKFVTRLADGLTIESVVIPMLTHATVCISSQVGCRMGCAFCETGRQGFHRNLTTDEVVGQVYAARFYLGYPVRNVVFMGMGEPLDNIDTVLQVIRILSDHKGLNIAKRHITLSTVGLTDGIRKLAAQNWKSLKLAISLNAPNDDIRSGIMPINRTVPMEMLRQTLLAYPLNQKSSIMIEYVLIKGVNASREHALQLARYLNPLKAKVNLIPVNPQTAADADLKPPSQEGIDAFKDWLEAEGVMAIKRRARGINLMAACGQLGGRQHHPRPSRTSRLVST